MRKFFKYISGRIYQESLSKDSSGKSTIIATSFVLGLALLYMVGASITMYGFDETSIICITTVVCFIIGYAICVIWKLKKMRIKNDKTSY